jgi:hypothetical protein
MIIEVLFQDLLVLVSLLNVVLQKNKTRESIKCKIKINQIVLNLQHMDHLPINSSGLFNRSTFPMRIRVS